MGYKRVLSGHDPYYSVGFASLPGSSVDADHNGQDRNLIVLGLSGEQKLKHNWFIGGNVAYECGGHDKVVTAGILLKKTW